jgi:hypothetical protein
MMGFTADGQVTPSLIQARDQHFDRLTAVDGAKLYDDWRQRVMMAVDTCLDEALALEDD